MDFDSDSVYEVDVVDIVGIVKIVVAYGGSVERTRDEEKASQNGGAKGVVASDRGSKVKGRACLRAKIIHSIAMEGAYADACAEMAARERR